MQERIPDVWQLAKTLAPGWKDAARKKAQQRGHVPYRWRLAISKAASERGMELPPDYFEQKCEAAA